LQYAATVTLGFRRGSGSPGPLLAGRIRPTPAIPCRHHATWVEPEFYCQVRCLERTARGRLRSACFQGLLGEARESRAKPDEPLTQVNSKTRLEVR